MYIEAIQFLRRVSIVLIAASLLCVQAFADQVVIDHLRVSDKSDHTRVVMDLSGETSHSIFTLSSPERVVLDIKNVRFKSRPSQTVIARSESISNMRNAARNGKDLRIVFDMKDRVRPKTFLLQPNEKQGYRLVLDLYPSSINKINQAVKIKSKPKKKLRDVIVAIDAGHGGKDPGAIGYNKTREKDVTLAISKKLAARINKQEGMRAVLIRDGDYFIPLRDRIIKARNNKADMFISIHADAFKDRRARGTSVYALSVNGATSEAARWLADRENSADLMGGIELNDKNELLASVLLDLSQTATIQSSLEVGQSILGQVGRVKKLHRHKVQQAGFVVLKSPDIPSVLVETAFITNPKEAKKLKQPTHQEAIARAITLGVRRYFSKKAPPDTWLAEQQRKKLSQQVAFAN